MHTCVYQQRMLTNTRGASACTLVQRARVPTEAARELSAGMRPCASCQPNKRRPPRPCLFSRAQAAADGRGRPPTQAVQRSSTCTRHPCTALMQPHLISAAGRHGAAEPPHVCMHACMRSKPFFLDALSAASGLHRHLAEWPVWPDVVRSSVDISPCMLRGRVHELQLTRQRPGGRWQLALCAQRRTPGATVTTTSPYTCKY